MSLTAETCVMEYLTRNGLAFVCPQFEIPYAAGFGGSSPDFVVIDAHNSDIAVVEVTTSSDLKGLLSRIEARQKRWFKPLAEALGTMSLLVKPLPPIRLISFIRGELVNRAYQQLNKTCEDQEAPPNDVTFVAIEDASFPWSYWQGRENGLPDVRTASAELPGTKEWKPRNT